MVSSDFAGSKHEVRSKARTSRRVLAHPVRQVDFNRILASYFHLIFFAGGVLDAEP